MAKSSGAGKRISAPAADVEVLSVSPHGIWLLVRDREYLLNHRDFPWFEQARVAEIFDVRLVNDHHLWWPSLDVDLHVESLAEPSRFPLVSRPGTRRRALRSRARTEPRPPNIRKGR
jgi:hypothetical protein